MAAETLLAIMALVCAGCLILERKAAWLAHISGVCLIIIVALFLATVRAIPSQHPLYDFFTGPTVPIALALMVLSLDLKALIQIPKSFLLIYCFGIIGTLVGCVVAVLIAGKDLGTDAALLAAQFSASYIGGGENAVAMQKVFNIPNALFVAGFAVDNILTSLWMVFTLYLARVPARESKPVLDQDSVSRIMDEVPATLVDVLFCVGAALSAYVISVLLNRYIGFLHPILYLTLVAFILAQLEPIKRHTKPAYLIGSFLFAAFFFSIGAVSNLHALANLSWKVILMPTVVVLFHGTIIFAAGWWLRVPIRETSLASQSLIGGPATAVALAQARNWKAGVPLGLLAGVLGYAIGNYFGYGMYWIALPLIQWLRN